MGYDEDEDFEEIHEANAVKAGNEFLEEAMRNGQMLTPEEIQQYQMQMIL